jgi:hypothetical protein
MLTVQENVNTEESVIMKAIEQEMLELKRFLKEHQEQRVSFPVRYRL